MKRSTLAALALATCSLSFARHASAEVGGLCPLANIGQTCGGTGVTGTCVEATCCDDPSGCAFAYDAGSGTSGTGVSNSSGSGGGGTGVSYACAVCQLVLGGPYCAAAYLGLACEEGGVCTGEGGGSEPGIAKPDGGMTTVSFGIQACETGVTSGDDAAAGTNGTNGTGAGAGTSGVGTNSGGSATGGTATGGGGVTGSGSANGGITGGTGNTNGSNGASSGVASTGGSGETAGTGPDAGDSGAGGGGGCDVGASGNASMTGLLGLAAVSSIRRRRRSIPG